MTTLLKAYLMGSNDPIVLAKAYYDEIKKDVRAVREEINRELPFWHRDMNELKANVKSLEEEIAGWESIYEEYEKTAALIEDEENKLRMMESTVAVLEDDPYESPNITEVESVIVIKDIPGFIEVIKDELSDVEQAIEDLELKRRNVGSKFRPGLKPDEAGPVQLISVHKLGLEMLQEQLDYHENLFQTLKDNKEIPQALPKQLLAARKAIANKRKEIMDNYRKLREKHMQTEPDLAGTEREGELHPNLDAKAPYMKEIRKLWSQLAAIGNLELDISSPEWRLEYHTDKIAELKERIKRSEKGLEEYGVKPKESESEDIKDERKAKAKEMGIKGNSSIGWFKRIKPEGKGLSDMPSREKWGTGSQKLMESRYGSRTHGTHIPPEHEWKKEYYEWDDKKKTFTKLPEKEVKAKEGDKQVDDFTFNEPEWFKLLAQSSSVNHIVSRDKFEQQLAEFFKKDRPEFKVRPIAGKTASGMGRIEYSQSADGGEEEKFIQENISTRLKNLEKLRGIFDLLPDNEKERGPPAIIISALDAEIETLSRKKSAESRLRETNYPQGNAILKEIENALSIGKNKIINYSDGKLPRSFLKEISKIRKTMLTLTDLQNFAEGRVYQLAPLKDVEKEKHRERMKKTFDRTKLTKVTELLNDKNKAGKKLIDLISKGWKDPSVFNPKTKRTKEETDKWRTLSDKFTGNLVKVIDRENRMIRDEYEGIDDATFEGILSEMKKCIQRIHNRKNEEQTEADIEDLRNLYNNLGVTVRKTIQKLSPESEERKTLLDIYSQITKEIMKIPELPQLVEDTPKKEWKTLKPIYGTHTPTGNTYIKGFEKEFTASPHAQIDRRREIVDELRGKIALANKEWEGENPYQDIKDNPRVYIEAVLPLVKEIEGTNKRNLTRAQWRQEINRRQKRAENRRERLIGRILEDKEIDDKHLLYGDEKQGTPKRRQYTAKPDPFADDDEKDTTTSQAAEMEEFRDIGAAGDEPESLPPEQDEFDEALAEERARVAEITPEEAWKPEIQEEVPEEEEEENEYEDWPDDDYDELAEEWERRGDDF